jgi:hypothetical protein
LDDDEATEEDESDGGVMEIDPGGGGEPEGVCEPEPDGVEDPEPEGEGLVELGGGEDAELVEDPDALEEDELEEEREEEDDEEEDDDELMQVAQSSNSSS